MALKKGHLEVARFLERCTYATARANNGWTPLHVAAEQGNMKVVRMLVEHGVDATARSCDGWTPLHAASSCGSMDSEVARFLIEHGANVTARANDGRTPLHVATEVGNVDVIRILIEHGADTTITQRWLGSRFYYLALCFFVGSYLYFMWT